MCLELRMAASGHGLYQFRNGVSILSHSFPSGARPGLRGRPEPQGSRLSGTQDSAFGSLGLNMGSRGQSQEPVAAWHSP